MAARIGPGVPLRRQCVECERYFDANLDHAGRPGYRPRLYCSMQCRRYGENRRYRDRRAAARLAGERDELRRLEERGWVVPLPLQLEDAT